MADTRMGVDERQNYLAGLHVGVLCIPNGDKAPLAAPVWYDYEPGGDIWLLTHPQSLKGKLLQVGTRVTMVAQDEGLPYKYASVEGTVSDITLDGAEEATKPMAIRYLGEEMGTAYAQENAGGGSVKVSITPSRWLTVDYGKA